MIPLARLLRFNLVLAIFYWTALAVAQSQPAPVYGIVSIGASGTPCDPSSKCEGFQKRTGNPREQIWESFKFSHTPTFTCDAGPGKCGGLPTGDANDTTVTGLALVGPDGTLKAKAEVTRPDADEGVASVSAGAFRWDHVTAPTRAPNDIRTVWLSYHLKGTVIGGGLTNVGAFFDQSVWQDKPIYKGKPPKGKWISDWWGLSGGDCVPVVPGNCIDGINGHLSITVESDEPYADCTFWTISLGIGGGDPNTTEEYRLICGADAESWYERPVFIFPKYNYTLASSLIAQAIINSSDVTHAVADWSNSVTIYIDDPGSVADSGHDFSDPARRKTQIIVKSSGPLTSANQVPDDGYKIVGGGAQAGSKHFLVASYPSSPGWSVGSFSSTPTPKPLATGYSLQLQDLNSRFKVIVVQSTSSAERVHSRPSAAVVMPDGFTLASGGCEVNKVNEPAAQVGVARRVVSGRSHNEVAVAPHTTVSTAPQSFLTGSYPVVGADGKQTWVCETQAQGDYPAGTVTAYAVGIKDLNSDLPVPMRIVKTASTAGSQPTTAADAIPGFVISGCGARAEPAGLEGAADQQFLTAIFPNASGASPNVASGCQAAASDSDTSASGTISAYAINLLLDRDVISTVYPNKGSAGNSATIEGPLISDDMKVQFVSPSTTNSVPITLFPKSVHRASIIVPNLPPGSYTLNALQGDVPSPLKGPTFVIQ